MDKFLRVVIMGMALTSLTSFNTLYSCAKTTETTVYICKGKYSKTYHYKKKCRGLNNCGTTIYTTTLKGAKKAGRNICGFED